MGKIFVTGGNRLNGIVNISGMKNSALPIIFACLLIKEECVLENIPMVSDVENALLILRKMGAYAEFVDEHTVKINTKNAMNELDLSLISKMRASSYLMSTCYSRFGEVCMGHPGGCNFGYRPIELHLKGFEDLGAKCQECDGVVSIKACKMPQNVKIVLDKISVGATINMVMASVIGNSTVIIKNIAKEPHVLDLITFLNICGADITVFENEIKVCGVRTLRGIKYRIYSDTIEALTFACFLGITGGELTLQNVEYEHLKCALPTLEKMGIDKRFINGRLVLKREGNVYGTNVVTAPYPLFPTDLHPQFSSLLCFCIGGGGVTDVIFPTRFAYVNELRKMGAKIELNGNTVKIHRSNMEGASLDATDLRAGAALVAAALGANGTSVINNVNYIIRGYECLPQKLSLVGADISCDY